MATRSGGKLEGEAPAGSALAPGESIPDETLEQLVRENLGWLRGWLRGRLRDPEAVHDVCQDAFLKALRAVHGLRDLSRFPAWLHRIAENTLRDHLRQKVRRARHLEYSDELDNCQASGNSESALSESEETEKLLAEVRALPARYREPLLLKHSRNISYAEIGRILGISENAVQVRIFRARKMLRSLEEEARAPDGVVDGPETGTHAM